MVRVTIKGKEYEFETGTKLIDVAEAVKDEYDARIILADVNGKLSELYKPLRADSSLDFRTVTSRSGFHTFRRTAIFVLCAAFDELYKAEGIRVKVEFSVSKGMYCTIKGDKAVDEEMLKALTEKMEEIIRADLPITKTAYTLDEAKSIFEKANMPDKVQLFAFRRTSRVNIYQVGDYQDYFYGYMAPSTGYVTDFKRYLYDEGFVLQLPTKNDVNTVPEFDPQNKVFATMKEANQRGIELDVETVGGLNKCICEGKFEELRLVTEAIQEGKISEIARDIASRDGVKFIMIAGPSSSGKTSFSYRLSTQLKAQGLNPYPIGLDNYYKDREFCPRDEDGNFDFECLEALAVDDFNQDMKKLLNGERVEIPEFNFKTGKREYHGNFIQLKKNDILVIEGIHGLNEKMSYSLPKESKYKVYISALTSLNIDEHNRIPTTDVRLLRRMVRDNRTRGTKASGTIAMWDSVRRGEENYIFPFQESADAVFNSALVYELAILKQFAEPLLFGIDKSEETYHEANRLLKFLDYFLGVTSEDLPNNSLLREFVGGSVFNV